MPRLLSPSCNTLQHHTVGCQAQLLGAYQGVQPQCCSTAITSYLARSLHSGQLKQQNAKGLMHCQLFSRDTT